MLSISIATQSGNDEFADWKARELKTELRQADFDARLRSEASEAGDKGDAVTVGTVVMALIGAGVAGKLVDLIGEFLIRNRSIDLVVTTPKGSLSIKGDRLDRSTLQSVQAQVTKLLA